MSIQDTCNQKKFINKLRTLASKESEVQKNTKRMKNHHTVPTLCKTKKAW